NNASIYPGAPEIPYDGIDQDCDGADLTDADNDGYEAAIVGGTDCDDNNADVNPGAVEIPYDGLDNDCDPATLDDDLDGDGYVLADDCDDLNASINPGMPEIPYNGVDDDCNASTPDDDLDSDGYNSTVTGGDDCNDYNPDINPGMAEIPYNGINDDCNPATVDDDLDGDGYLLIDDCNDLNASINPGMPEIPYNGVDDDCDPATPDDDLDSDGYDLADDCNDNDPNVNPGMAEIPYNGIDDDCNASTPDDDLDSDGYNSTITGGDDCDDNNAAVYPGAVEVCDGADNDCSGTVDDNLAPEPCALQHGICTGSVKTCGGVLGWLDCNASEYGQYYEAGDETSCDALDNDCDGIIDDGIFQQSGSSDVGECSYGEMMCILGFWVNITMPVEPVDETCDSLDNDCDGLFDEDFDNDFDTYTTCGTNTTTGDPVDPDCNDLNASINPGMPEIPYNGVDDDCDPATLDDDLDGDGYNYTDDCNDLNASINPGMPEIPYNGVDDDCNASTYDDDLDGDGYLLIDDCDDLNASINPGMTEIPYNGVDDDCDPATLDDDLDGDGYDHTTDCDDTDPEINPGMIETCDGKDNDCSGTVDDNLVPDPCPLQMGVCAGSTEICGGVLGWLGCDSLSYGPDYEAGNETSCDALDNDCDGSLDEYIYNQTGDTDVGECAYGYNQCVVGSWYVIQLPVNPVPELCDGLDNDCDALFDEDFDNDFDTYTTCGTNTTTGDPVDPDCDDTDQSVNPGAAEICNLVDDDCDGLVDEDGCSCSDSDGGLNFSVQGSVSGYGCLDSSCGDIDESDYCDNGSIVEYYCMPDGQFNVTTSDCQWGCEDGACLPQPVCIDNDGDSYNGSESIGNCGIMDCNDHNATINPGMTEIPYNGVDDDCDPATLDDDLDGDGYLLIDDCDDLNASINPGAAEIPYDGIDQDCDGADLTDADDDGYDAAIVGGTDCDDNNASINPGMPEIPYNGVDDDCNPATLDDDLDQDGYNSTATGGTDCNDNDPAINPGAAELCDNIDNDCNGVADNIHQSCSVNWQGICAEGQETCVSGIWFGCPAPQAETCDGILDEDCDGIVDDGCECSAGDTRPCPMQQGVCAGSFESCENGAWPGCGLDEYGPQYEPGDETMCDALDNDCDGQWDEDITRQTGSTDVGECSYGLMRCVIGFWMNITMPVGPVPELCDGLDNDCDALFDEDFDYDFDTYTTCGTNTTTGDPVDPDCNDYDATVYPGAPEVCDNQDNDCDSVIDMISQACSVSHYGICAVGTEICAAGVWDGCPAPQSEICEGLVDEDCNGIVDNGCQCTIGDTQSCPVQLGVCSGSTETCVDGVWPGCVDADYGSDYEPGAEASCDNMDNDCDGSVDEYISYSFGSGVGECREGVATCFFGVWYNTTISVDPAPEACDGRDNDCDGLFDEDFDADSDGYTACGTSPLDGSFIGIDCDDNDETIHPGAPELNDNIDQNCVNDAPTLQVQETYIVTEGDLLQVIALAFDTDGDEVFLAYGTPLDANGTWQTGFNDAGNYSSSVTASDGQLQVTAYFSIVVLETGNHAPVVGPVADITVYEGEVVQVAVDAYDPDNDPLVMSYSAPLDSNGYWQTGYTDAGVYPATVSVTDGSAVVVRQFTITVLEVGNQPPVLDDLRDISVYEGEFVDVDAHAYDPEGAPVTIAYSAPLDADGEWQTAKGDMGTYIITVTASDSNLSVSKTFTLTVSEKPVEAVYVDALQIINEDSVLDDGEVVALVRFTNSGDKDMKNARVRVTFDETGYSYSKSIDKLPDGESEAVILHIPLPHDFAPGVYTLRFTISNDNVHRVKHRDFAVY
ncbi:hypothetical protein JW968_06505, partial [Candidatus Woesearchaeota archaeon]|nr:hypothetical protein [Candidatus Woesearchaeota archaeon]